MQTEYLSDLKEMDERHNLVQTVVSCWFLTFLLKHFMLILTRLVGDKFIICVKVCFSPIREAYSEPCQTCKVEPFAKIVND